MLERIESKLDLLLSIGKNDILLMQGDCLERMKEIESGSVDMILTDPPYGTTACKWDSIIPLGPMWEQIKRIIKPNGAIVLFGQEPFSSYLRISNISQYKYDWYWRKARPSGFVNARLKPLKDIEIISVFSTGKTANGSKNNMPYFPQGLKEVNKTWKRPTNDYGTGKGTSPSRKSHKLERVIKYENYPRQVLDYKNHNGNNLHPTEKPVDLGEYLIKTYTNEGDSIVDFCMGSGSFGVAAIRTGRKFTGIELDENIFNIAKERIDNVKYR